MSNYYSLAFGLEWEVYPLVERENMSILLVETAVDDLQRLADQFLGILSLGALEPDIGSCPMVDGLQLKVGEGHVVGYEVLVNDQLENVVALDPRELRVLLADELPRQLQKFATFVDLGTVTDLTCLKPSK